MKRSLAATLERPHMLTNRPFSIAARSLVLSITAACVFLIGIGRPIHEWDIIGYVASAYQLDGYRGQDLRNKTFQDLRSAVDDDSFHNVTAGGDNSTTRHYRETVYSDPTSLSQQIPFYSIRFVYIELIRFVGNFTHNYSNSSHIVSAICAALAVVVLSRILDAAEVHFFALPIVVMVSGITEIARTPFPDSLAILFAFGCILSLLKRSDLSFLFSAILPMTRTDLILLSVIVLTLEFIKGNIFKSAISISIALASYVIINNTFGKYGFLTLLNFSEIATTPYPADIIPSSIFMDYVKVYIFASYTFVSNLPFFIYVLGSYFSYEQIKISGIHKIIDIPTFLGSNPQMISIYAIPVLYAISHILIFPHYEARYFVFSTALVSVWILSRLRALPARDALVGRGRVRSTGSMATSAADAPRSAV